MFINRSTKAKIQNKALIDAKCLFKGIAALARLLGVSRKRVSNWINLKVKIPYEYLIIISAITQISLERLSPFTERANKIIRQWRAAGNSIVVERVIASITVLENYIDKCSIQAQSILLGTDGVLISGLTQLEIYKAAGRDKTPVIILDLESLRLGSRTLLDLHKCFVISEQVATGLRLEQLRSNHQSQRNNLNKGINQNDESIARSVCFDSKDTYIHAKFACLQGISELVNAMDCKKISITKAAEIARLPENQQRAQLQQLGHLIQDRFYG